MVFAIPIGKAFFLNKKLIRIGEVAFVDTIALAAVAGMLRTDKKKQ